MPREQPRNTTKVLVEGAPGLVVERLHDGREADRPFLQTVGGQ